MRGKLALALCLISTLAFGQGGGGSVLPQGVITPGNCTKFGTSKYFVADAGSPCGAGAGSVTSVGLALPSIFTISGSPVTTAGTLTGSFNTQTANTFFAGPSSGIAAIPTFRTITTNDISGSALTRTNDTNVTLTLGGAPTVALLSPASLTLGWSGTLAAARLNSNVVQSITNDTNVTGIISAQNLTLGWTGTLGLNRGGTNADLSATGGTSQVLKQVSSGAAVTVARLACSDLSDSASGCSSATITAANPTATISTSAVNGSASTFMRSDAAPIFNTSLPYAFTGLGATTIAPATAVTPLTINSRAGSSNREIIIKGTVSDAGSDAFFIANGSSVDGLFFGQNSGFHNSSNTRPSMQIGGLVTAANDASDSSTQGLVNIQVGRTSSTSDPINNINGYILNRKLFTINNFDGTSQIIKLALFPSGNLVLASGATIGWPSSGDATNTVATQLGGVGTATLQLGAANAASPVNQILQVQGSRPGTDTNIAGANLTITSGNGTGTGTRSVLTLQSPVVVASGTGAQTMTTGWRVDNGTGVSSGYTVATLPASPLTGSRAHVTDAVACTFLATPTGGAATVCPVFYNGTAWVGG